MAVLRNFIQGLIPPLRDIVSWKQPKTFEAAFTLAQKKETILADLAQPEPLVVETPSFTATVQATVIPQHPSSTTSSSQTNTVAKLVEEFKELKLFVIQGQNARAKSPQPKRPPMQRSVQFVTCHGCGKRGHYKSDCPDNDRGKTSGAGGVASTSGTKPVEVNLLEFSHSCTEEDEPEIMMVKRAHLALDTEPPGKEHHKRRKSMQNEGPSTSERTKKTRRKIGNEDLLLSRGQVEYSIVTDLGKQTANITIGQLIVHCPSLRRELRQGISTRRPTMPMEVKSTNLAKGDLKSPQVEAYIDDQ
jgi:hypothetical protein